MVIVSVKLSTLGAFEFKVIVKLAIYRRVVSSLTLSLPIFNRIMGIQVVAHFALDHLRNRSLEPLWFHFPPFAWPAEKCFFMT